jgi:tetratricopeptide (TPR) repeat protein
LARSGTQQRDAASALTEALAAARQGDFPRARILAEEGIGAPGDPAPLHAFLGMILARLGEHREAANHLTSAHQARPRDVTIACNLIAMLIDMGADEEAFAVASADLSTTDTSLRVARYRGFLAQKLERYADAVAMYEAVVAQEPADFESWNNLGNARAALEDHSGSVDALRQAIMLDPDAAPTRINLSTALQAANQMDEAEAVLLQAVSDFPADARAPYELYVLYKRLSQQDEAIDALEQACVRNPGDADMQLKRAIEYGVVRRSADAEAAFRRTMALDPANIDAVIGLAIQYEHSNREDEFAPLIAQARAGGVPAGPLAFIEALEHRRAKRFTEGLTALDAVPDTVEPERTVHLRATLLDRLGRTEEAFAAFTEANRLLEAHPTEPLRRASELRAETKLEITTMTPQWRALWPEATLAGDARRDPVFLVGFPRSGTTLLDTILMGHPDAVVMEEQPPLNEVDRMIGGMMALPELSDAAIASARAHYFAAVDTLHPVRQGQLLIDKSPLFLTKLPLIARIFPDARIILALRHPCDVLLSCFMSNFRLNSAMSNFLRLEDAALFYDLVFRHWQQARSLFPLPLHTIVYERLIEDTVGEVRPLFDWLGLEWYPDALDHRRTAKARGLITTASYSQVAEPIYKRAAGRWERYRSYLEPALPVLAPWVERHGYSL